MTLDLGWARSMRIVRPLPRAIEALIVVGPSGAGKSTLVDAVREAKLAGVVVPMRYVTRPPRTSDRGETMHLSPAQFEQDVRDGSIAIHWERSLDDGRVVRYGFAGAGSHALQVLSANTAILSPTANLVPASVLANALVLGVAAPRPVREARLVRRSSDLPPAELAYRLSHDEAPDVHVTIDNHGVLEPIALAEIVALARRLASEAR